MPNSSDFNRFAVNPVNIDISRSLFNMDHSVKFSCDVGSCIPFEVTECLPGDTFTVDTTKVVRLQPLVAPIMDEVIMDTYYFFVPNRLVWNHWQNFMGQNESSAWAPDVEYNIPTITPPEGGFDVGTIADYMGIPPKVEGSPVSALPFRAYALIMDQWFRSEALMDPVHVHVDDSNRTGVNTGDQVTDIELGGKPFIACKYFDYFTGALPAPQRGQSVSLPVVDGGRIYLNGTFPVIVDNNLDHPYKSGKSTAKFGVGFSLRDQAVGDKTLFSVNSGAHYGINAGNSNYLDNVIQVSQNDTIADSGTKFGVFFNNLFTNVNGSWPVNEVTINDLRTAFAVQKYLEKQARYGGRYTEFIKGFFNVDSPDARLQRSEYLGGSRVSLNINQVEQTSATSSGQTPLGNVAGMSVTGDSNSDFTKSFTEHGYLIGIAVLRYHHSYQQGVDRMWFRKSPYSFYNPVMANLGEQEVDLNEIFYNDYSIFGETVFGYQERWAEYRYKPNRICGEMRSVFPQSLDMWHLADYYDLRPYLSADWIREDKSMLDRALAVTSDVTNQCICDFYIKMEASRPMPLYSIPGLIDHH